MGNINKAKLIGKTWQKLSSPSRTLCERTIAIVNVQFNRNTRQVSFCFPLLGVN
jgi:hypothetical protein